MIAPRSPRCLHSQGDLADLAEEERPAHPRQAPGTPVERRRHRAFDSASRIGSPRGVMPEPNGHPRRSPRRRNPLRAGIAEILDGYLAVKGGPFPEKNPVRAALKDLAEQFQQNEIVRAHPAIRVAGSTGTGGWAAVPWIAFQDARSLESVALLFCADMQGVYLTVVQHAREEEKKRKGTKKEEALRAALARRSVELRPSFAALEPHGFRLDDTIRLEATTDQGQRFEPATVAHKRYPKASLPTDAALLADLDAALGAYDRYVAETAARADAPAVAPPAHPPPRGEGSAPPLAGPTFDRPAALAELTAAIEARGLVFEPWQIAAYVTALRTKPFVILAGVSGTGKSLLPGLCAELMGGVATTLPVRPDWADSSDVLGFTDLAGRFQPGALLRLAEQAAKRPERPYVCVVDEMNLARVEQYFAEVLSRIEDRREGADGGLRSEPLLSQPPSGGASEADRWADVRLPGNLALVGTVNMDETTHGFSRKVLDRAFTLEISDIDLERWQPAKAAAPAVQPWPASAFRPRAVRLGGLALGGEEAGAVAEAVKALVAVNGVLGRAQLQVGYRVRDEVALFLLHAREVSGAFVTREGEEVKPLDLALMMKILPRIAGGSASVREVVTTLFGWASTGEAWATDEAAGPALEAWKKAGRPARVKGAIYPRMAARLALMQERLVAEGYTSFWA
jgi:MrcB-like, N-terminal domain/AAA domain (dynein-related subfamily)